MYQANEEPHVRYTASLDRPSPDLLHCFVYHPPELPEGDVWQRIEPMTFPRYLAFELSHNKWLHEIRTCHLARYTSALWRFQMLVRWGLRMRISYEMCKGRNGRLMRKEALEQLV